MEGTFAGLMVGMWVDDSSQEKQLVVPTGRLRVDLLLNLKLLALFYLFFEPASHYVSWNFLYSSG